VVVRLRLDVDSEVLLRNMLLLVTRCAWGYVVQGILGNER